MPAARSGATRAGAGFAQAWAAYAAFVVYGSLVPLDFHGQALDQAWRAFQGIPFLDLGVDSRADWVANGVLYAPLGALGALTLGRGRPRWGPSLLAIGLTWLLAVAVEFTQLFFPPRTVSQNDLIAEGLGTVIGVLAAQMLGPWLERWRRTLVLDIQHWATFLLPAYAAAYLLYCFFPFDLLLSPTELKAKLGAGNWGWLVARAGDVSPLRMLLLWVAEVLMTLPIGVWLWRLAGMRASWQRMALVGALLGLGIELGQMLIASGVSQGVSVLSRLLGVTAGGWVAAHWRPTSLAAARLWVGTHVRVLAAGYLLLLLVASGWRLQGWGGWSRAQVNWSELHFMPFYYHYFTTEAIALASLASVAFMYAPLGVLAWSRHAGAVAAGLLAALMAAGVETGKLFLPVVHPDPTNLLVAFWAVWAVVRYLPILVARKAVVASAPAIASAPEPAAPQTPTSLPRPARAGVARPAQATPAGRLWLLLVLTPLVAWALLSWPAANVGMAAVIVAAAIATWLRPVLLLAIVPAALPAFDLAPWTGRFFVDEFDLLCIACFGLAAVRLPRSTGRRPFDGVTLVFWLFGLSLAVSTVRGLAGAWPLDANSFSHYYSPFNGLRIAKGALLAWGFVGLYRRLTASHPAAAGLFRVGMAVGLTLTVVVVLWERLAFVGNLFDFDAVYRVTGPFSTMHKGGAYIECYLAVASAFVVADVISTRQRLRFWLGTALLVPAAYAVFVTYSRNGYAAFAAVVLAALVFGVRQAWGRARAVVALLVMLALVVTAALPVLGGSYARARLANSQRDLNVRLAHWQDALGLRDASWATAMIGVGVGRFPETHFWNSREARAAGFRIEPGQGNAFLGLGAGAPVYIDQIVAAPAGQELQLTLNVRAQAGAPELTVALCRKWTLSSSDCEQVLIKGIVAPGIWQTQEATISPLPAPTGFLEFLAPVRLSLTTPAGQRAVDVDNVSLAADKGANLIHNGSFAQGMDRWFFATDIDPPWHIHSLPVALLFDQGWLGLLSAAALLCTAAMIGARSAWRGSPMAIAGFTGLVAFLISGTLNTLIDAPRFLWLLLVLAWLCSRGGDDAEPAHAGRPADARAAP